MMDSLKRAEELLKHPAEQAIAHIQKEDLSFFKNLKNLTEEKASIAFLAHWDRIDNRMQETELTLQSTRKAVGRDDESAELVQDILTKAEIAFDIREEHKDRTIPLGHRLVIEATLIQAVDHVLDIVTQTCREFDSTRANALLDEQMELEYRMETRHLTEVFFETNERFLKSYLEMPW